MRNLILFSLLLGLISCHRPNELTPERLPSVGQQPDSKLRKIADVPSGPKSYMVHCVSASVCWVGDFTKQWRTDDTGNHWQLTFSAEPNGGEITSVDYVDERVAWILTLNKLYKTENGGMKWIEQASPLPRYPAGELRTLQLTQDGKIGWAGGGIYRPLNKAEMAGGVPNNIYDEQSKSVLELALVHTTDGGKTWLPQKIARRWGRIYGVEFRNEQHGMALASSGIFYTMDGGKHWKGVDFKKACTNESYLEGYDMRPVQVFLLDARNAWLSFEDGRIATSTDGGQTWCDLLAPNSVRFDYYEKYFKKIHFIDSSQGWGLGANKFLYETKDGGKTWTKGLDLEFDDLYFSNGEIGWLVSKSGLFQIGM